MPATTATGVAVGIGPATSSGGQATKVDCSGYVSRAWGLTTKRNVAGLISLCEEQQGYGNLQKGGMVAYPPNTHSRYFGTYNYPPTGWSVLESTISYGGHVVGKFYLFGAPYKEYHYDELT